MAQEEFKETIESAYAIKHNTSAPSLAVQELIDCSKKNYGCKGGDICLALNWVKGHGITYEKYYPLLDKDEDCKPIPPMADVVQISDFSCPSYVGKEDGILNILANHGPVAAAVDATTWNNYVGGIIRFHCSVPYYIVRNSWGTGFGMDGYLYIKIGDNLCGIAQEVSSVTIV
nr:hypothetical protein BaRGS_016855 [Batillaria attramentaria]